MKNLDLIYRSILSAAFLIAVICFSAAAQALPNVQTVGVLAPPGVKTDGKLTEWGGRFEAYNKHTSVYYTMANDNERLYLTIMVTDTATITKIWNRGITLTLKNAGKSNRDYPFSLTYPVLRDLNQIKVTGSQQLTDSLIQIPNKFGIAAVGLFHSQTYSFELALSLKYLVPLINDVGTFNYNIAVNEDLGHSTLSPMVFSGKYTLVMN